MLGTIVALAIGFMVFEAVGYGFHRLLHTRWTGSLNKAHMTHHLKLYPPEDYLSNPYRGAGADNTTYRFVAAALVVALAIALVFPWSISLPLLGELALVGALNSYVHDSTHIRGHWLERFWIYRRWRALHYQHHVDMTRNYGIVTFLVDRVAGTYQAP